MSDGQYEAVNQEMEIHDESVEIRPRILATSVLSSTTMSAASADAVASQMPAASPVTRERSGPHSRRQSHFEALIQQARKQHARYVPSSPGGIAEGENEGQDAGEPKQAEENQQSPTSNDRPNMGRTESTFFDIGYVCHPYLCSQQCAMHFLCTYMSSLQRPIYTFSGSCRQ